MLTSSLPRRLNKLSNYSNVNQWNSQIREAVNKNHAQRALLLFRQMKQNDVDPDHLTFPFVAKACSKISNIEYSEMIHTHIVKSPFGSDVFVQTTMVDAYVKCDRLNYAYMLFDEMAQKDATSWNVILVGFAQKRFLDKVLNIFRDMRFEGMQPDSITVIGLTQSCLHETNLNLLKAIHSFGTLIGINADISVVNTWISAYAKCSDLISAELLFHEIEEGLRTVVSWNSLMAGYAGSDKFFQAFRIYKHMMNDGFTPNASTIVSLLSSCTDPGALFHGKLIHSHGIQWGCVLDISVTNTFISMYSKCGDIDSARFLFDTMYDRTCVSWTVMISGYAEKGDMDAAVDLLVTMEVNGEIPDLVTLLSLILGCGKRGSLELGKWVDNYASSKGLKDNVIISNALIDMYAKCGSIGKARTVFYMMRDRNVISWSTMIAACALNGEFTDALYLFNRMVELGLKPNHITFIAVLQACTHGGFLEKGWEYFNMMTKVYNINPGIDHYSCMTDLLGRKGKLKEALELVREMPMEPDAGIWGALLSACKIHRHVEIGEYVADRLLLLDPHVAAPYVEMANIYASGGRWDGVAKIRSMMKSNKVKKFPGQSLVEINGEICSFTVEDRDHPLTLQIYMLLDSLTIEIKEKEALVQHSEDITE